MLLCRLGLSLSLSLCLSLSLSLSLNIELKELVKMHGGEEKENEEPLTYDEVLIVKVQSTCTYM